ncbi:MAG: NTP transferase domain-containing protein [Limnochordia bacterium]
MGKTAAVILAAGEGSRMLSKKAKVLHRLAGLELVNHVVRSVREAAFDRTIVVIGYQGDKVRQALSGVELVEQKEQRGTGHAVYQCREALKGFSGNVLVTYGDTPLFRGETFANALKYHEEQGAAATIVTAIFDDPTGYGRVIRDGDRVLGVKEHKDASPDELAVTEINTGTYCFRSELLFEYLTKITPDNAQTEYYLPDVLPLLLKAGHKVAGYVLADPKESMGINDRSQLAEAEAVLRDRLCRKWMDRGVTIIDPATTWIEHDCTIGEDTVIYPNTYIQQGTEIGSDCIIGPNCRLSGAKIGDGVVMENTIVVGRHVDAGSHIAPFTFLTS